MKPLLILLTSFILVLAVLFFSDNIDSYKLAGNISMAIMLIFTAIGHFAFPKGMTMMLPPSFPAKYFWVYGTGIIELAAAAGLLIPSLRHITAILLIIFFILILPANIYAAVRRVDYQKATYNGPGTNYLWFRIPMQALLILWVYFFSF